MGSGGTNFWGVVCFLGLSDTGLFGVSCFCSCFVSFWSCFISFCSCWICWSSVFGCGVIGCAFWLVDHVDACEVADGV